VCLGRKGHLNDLIVFYKGSSVPSERVSDRHSPSLSNATFHSHEGDSPRTPVGSATGCEGDQRSEIAGRWL
jgi:hypothetical protein